MNPSAAEYYMTSRLAEKDANALEELFYFNPNQQKIRASMEAAVRQFGTPQIKKSGGRWRLVFQQFGEGQALFLYKKGRSELLAGVVMYIRDANQLRVLFWGLHPDHTFQSNPQQYLLLHMMESLREAGRKIVGIEKITFLIGSNEHSLRV